MSIHVTVLNVLTRLFNRVTFTGVLTVLCYSFHPVAVTRLSRDRSRNSDRHPRFVVTSEIRSDGCAGNVRRTIGCVKFFLLLQTRKVVGRGRTTRARFNAITQKFHYVPQNEFLRQLGKTWVNRFNGFPWVRGRRGVTFSLFSSEKYIYKSSEYAGSGVLKFRNKGSTILVSRDLG